MSTESFQSALKLRLGIPFHNRPEKCVCKNKKNIDCNMTHILSCVTCGRHNIEHRHYEIQREIQALAIDAHIRVSAYGLNLENGSRADLELHGEGKEGKNLMVDITIPFSACESHRQHAFEDKDYTINNSKKLKLTNMLLRVEKGMLISFP